MSFRYLFLFSTYLLLFTPDFLRAEETATDTVRGRVETRDGIAIERSRVEIVNADQATFTSSDGSFEITGCPAPCLLLVTHPRFTEQVVELRAEQKSAASGTVIVLEAKQAIFEQISVTANRGGSDNFAPLSTASTIVEAQEKAAAPTTLTELVEGVAGVSENGQGGLFQVFSVRGVSRNRVLTLVSGIPITSERRAGVSTSFIDPSLIGSVDVLRGPSSTYYGSGALGGVVQVFPRTFDGFSFEMGFNTFGDENFQHLGWGTSEDNGDGWSFGLARRSAGDDEAADGTELNSEFSQLSAALTRRWTSGDRSYEVLVLPTYGEDIGKPNTDFPDRVTDYPRERHLLMRFEVQDTDGWSLQAFVHPNDLQTDVLRVNSSLTEVINESFDFGAGWQKRFKLKGSMTGRWGIDYSARRSVDATEKVESLTDGSVTLAQTLNSGTQDEVAAFGSVRWSWGATNLQAGSRVTWHQQGNGDDSSRDDSAVTGFVGLVHPLGKGFELTANLGTGFRFPSLSERFFTGTTGRGQVIGNPDLDPEKSVNTDLGIRWFGKRSFLSAQVFQLDIEDYIERIDIPGDLRTFVNLSSGEILGFELEGSYQPSERWYFSWSGHLLDGDDDNGTPLADIPADRFQVGARYRLGPWESRLQLQLRREKDDPGSGEVEISSAELVSAAVSYRITPDLQLTLRGKNLLDEIYRNSADDKVTFAPGRSVGLSLSWSAF